MTVRYSPEASELDGYLAYVAERNPLAARYFAEQLSTLLGDLATCAFDGPKTVLTTGEHVQSWPLSPLRIYYQMRGDFLYVLRIRHQTLPPGVGKTV